MKRKFSMLLGLVLIMTSVVGCNEQNVESELKDVINEYALYVGDLYYPIDNNYIFETMLEEGEFEDFSEEFPYPAGKRHFVDGLKITTFIVDDERGQGETIFNILATKNAITPRGVGIGDTLADLQAAYPDLKYEAGWLPDETGPKFNRVYIYASEGSRNYIAFFLYEKEVVMIEVAEGFDFMPGEDINDRSILGISGVLKETNDMSSKGANFKYFYKNEFGEEKILIDIFAGYITEVDIDDDGTTELIVDFPGSLKAIGIYDLIEGEISYIDVNEELGSFWSSSMESIANLKPEYGKCIQAGFKNDDGTQRTEIYRVVDNELIYVCPFSDDVLM